MIFVTGATGNVGGGIVELLQIRQITCRVGVRPGKVTGASQSEPNCQRVPFDFNDPATFAPAVAGCTGLFLLRPPAVANTGATLNRLIDVARQAGVTQIVFLSVAGTDRNPLIPHHAVEKKLQAAAGGWTLIRAGFFAQNLGAAYRHDIRHDNRIYLPAGSGRVAFVDTRDLAEVALMALTDPMQHQQVIYELTGAKAITFYQVVQILTAHLERAVRYTPASVPGYITHLRKLGLPAGQIAIQTLLHVGLRFGQAAKVDPTLARLLGRPPRTMDDYVRDHRELWL